MVPFRVTRLKHFVLRDTRLRYIQVGDCITVVDNDDRKISTAHLGAVDRKISISSDPIYVSSSDISLDQNGVECRSYAVEFDLARFAPCNVGVQDSFFVSYVVEGSPKSEKTSRISALSFGA